MNWQNRLNGLRPKPSKGACYLFAGLLALALLPASLNAAVRTASVTGNWSNTTTWGGAPVPTSASEVIINAGVIVTMDTPVATSSTATINGTVKASRVTNSSWTLVGGDLIINAGGTLDYGSESDTIPTAINAHLVLAYGATDGKYGLIVNNGGNFTVRGSTKTPYAFASASIGAADTSLTVYGSTSVAGWQAGDVITIGPTSGNGVATTSSRTITSVAGGPAYTINWSASEPLGTARTLSSTSPIIVGNLTRNVLVQSSGTVVYGAGSNSAYILNLAQNATSFSLTQGEFAYIGAFAAGQYGITFDGAMAKGSVSSSTIRSGYYGIYLNNSSTITLTGNNFYSNSNRGISLNGASNNTLTRNNSCSHSVYGIALDGPSNNNTLTGNYSYSNSYGIYLSVASNNTLTGNNFYSNNEGIYLLAAHNNTLTGNNSYSNTSEGISLPGSNNNTLTENNFYSNSNWGIYLYGNNNTFAGNNTYSNPYGIYVYNSAGNTFIDGNIGYNADGVGLKNSTAEIYFEPGYEPLAETLILKGTRVNPAVGISTVGIDVAGASIISYNQDYDTGTVRIWGNYQLAGSTLALEHDYQLYASSATTPKLMRGTLHSANITLTDDQFAVSQLVTIQYRAGQWHVDGSVSGPDMRTFTGTQFSFNVPMLSAQFKMNFTQGTVPQEGDTVDFVLTAASKDANIQKKLLFGPSNFNSGRSKLEIDSTGGIVLRGKADGTANTLINWLGAASTYYTFVDSGAFTAEYSSFTNMDPDGIQLSGNKGVAISSSTFDYLGFASGTNTFITARDLVTASTFHNVYFGLSRSSVGFSSAYNVRVQGNDTDLAPVFRKNIASLGPLWGEAYNYDPNFKVTWADDTLPPPPGVIISTMVHAAVGTTQQRAMVRDSLGNLYLAYQKRYNGRRRIFLSRSTDNGATWADTTAAPIETAGDVPSPNSYDQESPALAIDSKDVLHLVFGGTNNVLDIGGIEPKCVYSSAAVPGTTWSPYVKIPAHTYAGYEGEFNIAADSRNGLHIAWSGQDCGTAGCSSVRYSSRSAESPSWSPYISINNDGKEADGPVLAIDAKDGVHLLAKKAFSAGTYTTPVIIYSSRPARGGWGGWATVYSDAGARHQDSAALAIDSAGNTMAAWSSADATYSNPQVKFALKPKGGNWGAWNYAQLIAEAPQRDPRLAPDAAGNIYMVWSGSSTANPVVNIKKSVYNGASWSLWENLSGGLKSQTSPRLRWSGWRNNAGGLDVVWNDYDGVSSTATLLGLHDPLAAMSPGWSPLPGPSGCGASLDVRKTGVFFNGIQEALDSVPASLSTATCVVIRDADIYSEQVTVKNISNNGYRLKIMADPTLISSAPAVNPPAGSNAAFNIYNDSVSVQGINIISTNTVPYGIYSKAANLDVSSVNVISGWNINSAGIYISSRSAVAYSSITVQSAYGLRVTGKDNKISFSTMTCLGSAALYIDSASSNTVKSSYIANPSGQGAAIAIQANYNEISGSTMTSATDGSYALFIIGATSNTVTNSVISNTAGNGAGILNGASYNAVSDSVITGNSGTGYGLRLFTSVYTTVARSFISNPAGTGVIIDQSDDNSISASTVTGNGAAYNGVRFDLAARNSLVDSYVQGSTAVFMNGSAWNAIGGSVLVADLPQGNALILAGGSMDMTLSSSTLKGGAQGAGIYLYQNLGGIIKLSSNTITGGQSGVSIEPQPGATLNISSITFASLTPGATAIDFMFGQFVLDITSAAFNSPNINVNVNGSNLSVGSLVNMPGASGPRYGAGYENDLGSYVYWDTIEAVQVGPVNGATGVPQAASVYVRAPTATSSVQYQYQFDTAPTWTNPSFGFDQTDGQTSPLGAFSGQDSTILVTGDSYLYNSTATVVFYSTTTALLPESLYYWRARARTKETGEYGPWTTITSFTTGAPASTGPVNNLAVTQVLLSSPTLSGVNIGFTLSENNVSTGTTANGAYYNTADWIFVKFSTAAGADGTWNHATLSLTGGSVGGGGMLTVAADKKGAFLDHTSVFPLWQSPVSVVWDYVADGVSGTSALVKVFAISMVKVPQGQFVYNAGGIGGAAYNNYGNGSQSNVLSATDRPTGADPGWPNGYGPFYIMRYELTQGQYADFLNSVHSSTAATLYATETDYGHQMNNGGIYPVKYFAADRFAAKNFLSTSDLWSFLSWAALRPMTEMEFEKAGRDIAPDARKYPWGNTEPDTATYGPPNEGGTHIRNFMNYNNVSGGQKVLASGRYMSGDTYHIPEQTGASPYGITDLAGNVFEHILNCSYLSVPANGNGTTAPPAGWPTTDSSQKGLRGGYWYDLDALARVSSRGDVEWQGTTRDGGVGGRGVRMP